MSLNLDAIFQKLGDSTEKIENDISNFLDEMDSSNTEDILKLQQYMQKWSIAIQTQSNTVKTISDGIKSTVQNIR